MSKEKEIKDIKAEIYDHMVSISRMNAEIQQIQNTVRQKEGDLLKLQGSDKN